jgi:DNA (cytosine-5)-methyltransferase 1
LNHIELFAGCGGLSLGLEQAKFELVLANELSPMAAETFAYNFLGENLSDLAAKQQKHSKVFWLSSKHKDLSSRLRENPFEYPALGEGETDIPKAPKELDGSLVVGNLIQLNQLLRENNKLLNQLKDGFGRGGIDLVSGGPPCQSFSLAGLRKKDCDKNVLPWEFAKFVEMIQPKIAMLENVTGILRPFNEDGVSYYAWFEVAKAFAEIGYVPLCLHINARFAGVPQNRPRFIMIAVRSDFYLQTSKAFSVSDAYLFDSAYSFFNKIKNKKEVILKDLNCFDAHSAADFNLMKDSFLTSLVTGDSVTVKEALDDIKFVSADKKSSFVKKLNKAFESFNKVPSKLQNHEARRNNELVQRRFRLYQVLQICGKAIRREVVHILKTGDIELSDASWSMIKSYEFLTENKGLAKFKRKSDFMDFLRAHQTKKLTQKALDPDSPASAALSIPDDVCHYSEDELRTLTVREMARIQSFPDAFVFRSKVTTGGQMRKFEVPQYTQVGNAVPPLLGFALGKSIANLLQGKC